MQGGLGDVCTLPGTSGSVCGTESLAMCRCRRTAGPWNRTRTRSTSSSVERTFPLQRTSLKYGSQIRAILRSTRTTTGGERFNFGLVHTRQGMSTFIGAFSHSNILGSRSHPWKTSGTSETQRLTTLTALPPRPHRGGVPAQVWHRTPTSSACRRYATYLPAAPSVGSHHAACCVSDPRYPGDPGPAPSTRNRIPSAPQKPAVRQVCAIFRNGGCSRRTRGAERVGPHRVARRSPERNHLVPFRGRCLGVLIDENGSGLVVTSPRSDRRWIQRPDHIVVTVVA